MTRRLLVIDCAGLSYGLLRHTAAFPNLTALARQGGGPWPLRPTFPAVTCSVQATLTTGVPPAKHGIIANGYFDRERLRTQFWEQSDRLVQSERIWETLRSRVEHFTSAMLFWQNSIGSSNDVVLTPAPIHKHHGGMIQDCYARPAGLYQDLVAKFGKFSLWWYWGPLTSIKATQWIGRATAEVLRRHAPNLCLTYLPHLDYNQQRWGPDDPRLAEDCRALDAVLGELLDAAKGAGYESIVLSDYGMTAVRAAVPVNRILREAGFLSVRRVGPQEWLDFAESRAWAMADHQIAHLFVRREEEAAVGDLLRGTSGVERVLDRAAQREAGIDHARSGELVAIASRDAWFSYPWWADERAAPDFASHVDIHNKPGYDPCELFWQWFPPLHVPNAPERIRGSHGRVPDSLESHGICVTGFPPPSGPTSPEGVTDVGVYEMVRDHLARRKTSAGG
ncbi:MAG: alkaline phosphatase family protein [Planctomycetes bacterium]|nr:alkaline phosphatase family protein [Planctomycetota bacterium]